MSADRAFHCASNGVWHAYGHADSFKGYRVKGKKVALAELRKKAVKVEAAEFSFAAP